MRRSLQTTKKVFTFAIVFLMAASTFMGGNAIEVKADVAETVYKPYYDEATGEIVGAPEVGTVLTPGTIISGEALSEDVSIEFHGYALKELFEEEVPFHDLNGVSKGETIDAANLTTMFSDSSAGWVVGKVEFSKLEYESGTYKNIVISYYPKVEPTEVKEVALEVDWTKLNFVVGESLGESSFGTGFLANDYLSSESGYMYINVKTPGGEWEMLEGKEGYVVNEEDSYALSTYIRPAAGYYFTSGSDVTAADTDIKIIRGETYSYHGYEEQAETGEVLIELGTGAEILSKIEAAKAAPEKPSTDGNDGASEDGGIDPIVVAIPVGIGAIGAGAFLIKKFK